MNIDICSTLALCSVWFHAKWTIALRPCRRSLTVVRTVQFCTLSAAVFCIDRKFIRCYIIIIIIMDNNKKIWIDILTTILRQFVI